MNENWWNPSRIIFVSGRGSPKFNAYLDFAVCAVFEANNVPSFDIRGGNGSNKQLFEKDTILTRVLGPE